MAYDNVILFILLMISMQAVLLMAGKGTRWAKDFDGPKQLEKLAGKPILEHTLDAMPDEVTEFIFVVGGPHEPALREHFASGEYKGRPIEFVVQKEQLGLAHAFKTAKHLISGEWMGMIADDIIGAEGLVALAKCEGNAVLGYKVSNPEAFGVLVTDDDGNLVKAIEKPKEFVSDLVWTGHMKMSPEFMEVDVEPSDRGEYETPDVWMKLVHDGGQSIKVIETDLWLPINEKAQFEEAERVLIK